MKYTLALLLIIFTTISLGCTDSGEKNDAPETKEATPEKPKPTDDATALNALDELGVKFKKDADGLVIEADFRGLEFDDDKLAHLADLTRIRSVKLNDTNVRDDAMAFLAKATTIVDVDIRGCPVSNDGIANLKPLQLRALRMNGVDGDCTVDDGAMETVATFTELRALFLDGLFIGVEGIEKLTVLPNLSELYLARTLVGDETMSVLAKIPTLKKLRLSQTQLSDIGLADLAKLEHLEDLDVSENSQIFDAGLEHLSGISSLKRLNLWRVQIGDPGVEHLAPLTNLEWLNLDNTLLSDSGLPALANMQKLTFLHLGSTTVSDTGLQHLEGLTQLEELMVTRTAVTEDGAASLQEHLKNTKIQLKYLGDE